ncbi:retron St85 family RNA-directed DNA polymerase [Rossellomorea yichunensis]|uniref:retron St85 family RNA-directed DNA polymerase n=1 Tax=Rossellomorea yichunensis TaxID=3077331 RepID=UPI0028E014F7|nr:retron St85 family RNA-directed DNA polymerase [Rossellomorea sp. YC4-1]MDT9025682.1 retron St85 family RNA-directed DNA polymerase [Rossellomorea sp. YC4-1]
MSNKMIYILDLPNFCDSSELSTRLNISEYTLNKITFAPEYHYKEIKKLKANGDIRILACPSQNLKAIQAWVLRTILDQLPVHNSCTAFRKGINLRDNANKHKGSKYFLCLDIKDFFPSITSKKVYNFFRGIGYGKKASLLLKDICTYKGGLPQGGVTSPSLSNLLNIKLDRRLAGYAGSKNIIYSRYADDIVLSCKNPEKLLKAKSFIEYIIKDEGYTLNGNKVRLLRPGMRREITGLVYSEKEEIGIGRVKKRELRAKIHRMCLLQENTKEYGLLLKHIEGWFSYLLSVDKVAHDQLRKYFYDKKQKYSQSNIEAAASLLDELDELDF